MELASIAEAIMHPITQPCDLDIWPVIFRIAVVERVMQRPHTLSKKSLNVSLHVEEEDEPCEDFSCTVEVSGGSVVLDKEMMELYFESKKAGEYSITKIEVMKEMGGTLITFKEQRGEKFILWNFKRWGIIWFDVCKHR